MALEDWAQRTLPRVAVAAPEGTPPDPAAIATIVLSAEGTTLESWSAPFAEVQAWILEAKAVIDSFAEDFPKRRIPLLFTASNAAGDIKTQCTSSVQGKNQNADALIGGGSSAPKAFADAMTAISALQVTTLKQAREMLDWQAGIIKQKDEQIHQFAEYFRVKQEVEATEAKTNADASGYILEQVKTILPLGLEAASVFVEERKQGLAAKAAEVAAKAANPSNGVIKS